MGNINGAELIGHLLIYMVVLLFAISAHEAAHAWMSSKFGDNTARMLGRVTLNPVAHTDPIGTLFLPVLGFLFAAMGGFYASIPLIGWGKPTPVEPRNWTNYKTANVMVSVAGILANLTIAICAFIIIKILLSFQVVGLQDFFGRTQNPIAILLDYALFMNVSLAIFNLLPFPPLDGSKILSTFLPSSFQPTLDMLEQYGFLILMALLYFGIIRAIMIPVQKAVAFLLLLGENVHIVN